MPDPDKPIGMRLSVDSPRVPHEDLDGLYNVLSPYVGDVTHAEWNSAFTEEGAADKVELLDTLHTYLLGNPERIKTAADLRRIIKDIKVILAEGPPKPPQPGEEYNDEYNDEEDQERDIY